MQPDAQPCLPPPRARLAAPDIGGLDRRWLAQRVKSHSDFSHCAREFLAVGESGRGREPVLAAAGPCCFREGVRDLVAATPGEERQVVCRGQGGQRARVGGQPCSTENLGCQHPERVVDSFSRDFF